MKRLILLFLLSNVSSLLFSQTLLLEENFDYAVSDNLSSHGWTIYSGTTNAIVVNSSGLSYSGYPSSGVGNSIDVDNDGEDYYRSISSSQTSGVVYFSFLVKVTNATSGAGDYFIGLGSTAAGTVGGRLWLKRDASNNVAFGISKTSTSPTFTSYSYSLNTTYLIVIKYIINSGAANDDVALFVITGSIPDTEPAATVSHATESGSDPANISVVALRQAITTNIATVDGIRVATAWSLAPLPVELILFKSNIIGNKVELNWKTATEVNNYGFEIERSQTSNVKSETWEKIGFVHGNGNSSSPKNYSFTDEPLGGKEFKYRLKQIDFNGAFEYSEEVTAILQDVDTYKLEQNYPNPFNPITKISYTIPQKAFVRLRVYDMLAREIGELVNTTQDAGRYEVTFDGTNLPSGAYFYKLEAGKYVEVKKLLLVK